MLKKTGTWLMPVALFYMLAGCGYYDDNPRTYGDNRNQYLIKNRNQANEYKDVQNTPNNRYRENVDPKMESAQSLDEQEDRRAAFNISGEQTQNYVEQMIWTKVMQIPGISGADVQLQGSTVRITIDVAKGDDQMALADKVKETIRLLYNYHVIVSVK